MNLESNQGEYTHVFKWRDEYITEADNLGIQTGKGPGLNDRLKYVHSRAEYA